MAKRRKLEAPDAAELAALEEGFAAKPVPDRFGITVPPIASVVAEAARLSEPGTPEQRVKAARDASDAGAWREAVEQGRVVENLPLAAIALDHIVRDRMSVSREEMEELKTSLRTSGQRLPVEVVPVGDGRYGLISGWRRVTALRELAEQGGVQTVRAIVRHFGIQPRQARLITDIKGRSRSVDTYPLGEIREGIKAMHDDPEERRAVKRVIRGARARSAAV